MTKQQRLDKACDAYDEYQNTNEFLKPILLRLVNSVHRSAFRQAAKAAAAHYGNTVDESHIAQVILREGKK